MIRVVKPAARSCYHVTPDAVEQARFVGIGGSIADRLIRMARRSAPITHDSGNRRFDDFILRVEDREIMGVSRM